MNKRTIILGMIWGGIIGGYIPIALGAGTFSLYSILGSFLGGVLGIWLSFKYLN